MIVFVHLLNDRSGSPRILRSAIRALSSQGLACRLFVGSEGDGWLAGADIPVIRYWYKRTPYRLFTLLTYLASQASLLIRLLRDRDIDRDALIYVNTLLPFGAAIYGWLTGRPVVYHLHEVSLSPAPLRWLLTRIARRTGQQLIYVTKAHRDRLPISGVPACIVYNALDTDFLARAQACAYRHRHDGRFSVLMLASLRDYKGVPQLVALAKHLAARQDIRFDLVANDEEADIRRYFSAIAVPPNLIVHARTADPAAYYGQASLVLNLSRIDQCVETFGLTLLEAMAYGVPVIAPPIGGPAELVADGREGFLIDSRQTGVLAEQVLKLADDESLCFQLSEAARSRSAQFTPAAFDKALGEAVGHVISRKSID